MQRDYQNIRAILNDLGQWKCLWTYDACSNPIPCFWHCSQIGRISWRCNGLYTLAGAVESLTLIHFAAEESPDNAHDILARWIYRSEAHFSRPEMLENYNLQQCIPFKYRMQECKKGRRAAHQQDQNQLFS